jgi:hypothetical protein
LQAVAQHSLVAGNEDAADRTCAAEQSRAARKAWLRDETYSRVELRVPACEVLGRIATPWTEARPHLERRIDAMGLPREELGLPERIAAAYDRHLSAGSGRESSVWESGA